MLRFARLTDAVSAIADKSAIKVIIRRIALIAPAAGLFGLSISYSQPAVAAVSCQSNTAFYHSNNSLAGCVLSSNTDVLANNNHFSCKEEQPIYFTTEGQFSSCTLIQSLIIQRGSQVETCPINAKVSFSVSQDGSQSITCSRL